MVAGDLTPNMGDLGGRTAEQAGSFALRQGSFPQWGHQTRGQRGERVSVIRLVDEGYCVRYTTRGAHEPRGDPPMVRGMNVGASHRLISRANEARAPMGNSAPLKATRGRPPEASPRIVDGAATPSLLPAQERAWAEGMQRAHGNQATAAMLSKVTERSSMPFKVTIRGASAPTTAGKPSQPSTSRDDDAMGGTPDPLALDPATVTSALLASGGAIPDVPPEGGSVKLPDLVMPASLEQAEQDSVAGTLTYSGSVAQSGAVSPFGCDELGDLQHDPASP